MVELLPDIIETDRLILTEISVEDTDTIVRWRSDPNVYRFFKHPHALTADEHRKWYEGDYSTSCNKKSWIARLIDGDPVGLFGIAMDGDTLEVSYLLDGDAQGKGYASEAMDVIIVTCAELLNAKELKAVVHEDNLDSIRFIERMGFAKKAQEGSFIQYSKTVQSVK